ncbi:hypothetical protein TrispH2_001467 [Trichoplax sp. H2]|nr:hypothetical protein TrispH2_001467 [Trichoplax sp. H2]|eukprot:RDD46234.1 hypothetical protein TrispH2_001467 [Trichoplax sp. H2]
MRLKSIPLELIENSSRKAQTKEMVIFEESSVMERFNEQYSTTLMTCNIKFIPQEGINTAISRIFKDYGLAIPDDS